MKLPTLNIDLSVNTANLTRGLAKAEGDVAKFGTKATKIIGAGAGISSLGQKLGLGTRGQAAFGAAGLAYGTITSVFGLINSAVESLRNSSANAAKTMADFAESGRSSTGLSLSNAIALESVGNQIRKIVDFFSSLWDTFIASSIDPQTGQSAVLDYLQAFGEGLKTVTAFTGAFLGGQDTGAAIGRATAGSIAGEQAYMTPSEIDAMQRRIDAEKERKQRREIDT